MARCWCCFRASMDTCRGPGQPCDLAFPFVSLLRSTVSVARTTLKSNAMLRPINLQIFSPVCLCVRHFLHHLLIHPLQDIHPTHTPSIRRHSQPPSTLAMLLHGHHITLDQNSCTAGEDECLVFGVRLGRLLLSSRDGSTDA